MISLTVLINCKSTKKSLTADIHSPPLKMTRCTGEYILVILAPKLFIGNPTSSKLWFEPTKKKKKKKNKEKLSIKYVCLYFHQTVLTFNKNKYISLTFKLSPYILFFSKL